MTLHVPTAPSATYDFARTDVNGERRGARFFTRLALALGSDFRKWPTHSLLDVVCETAHLTLFRSVAGIGKNTALRDRVLSLAYCVYNREYALNNREVLLDAYDAGVVSGDDMIAIFANSLPALAPHPVYHHQQIDGGSRRGVLLFLSLLNDLGPDWRNWREHPDFEFACWTAHHCVFKGGEHFVDGRGMASGLDALVNGPSEDGADQAVYAHAFRDAFDAGLLTFDDALALASRLAQNAIPDEQDDDRHAQRKRWRTPEEITQIVVGFMERAKAGEPSPKGKERMTVTQIARRMITQRIDQNLVRECHEAFVDAGWVDERELHPAI